MTARLDEILDELVAVVADNTPVRDAARIDRIARLEKLRAATAALQVAESVRFAQSQVAEQLAADVHPDKIGRGIAEQIGLACRISPTMRRGASIRRGHCGLSCPTPTGSCLREVERTPRRDGSERTRHLDPEKRRQVDEQLKAAGIARMGFKTATACIPQDRLPGGSHRATSNAAVPNANTAVGVRPAPDTMAVLTGYLPVEQGIAYAALRQHADTAVATGDGRTRDQIMADTLGGTRHRAGTSSQTSMLNCN